MSKSAFRSSANGHTEKEKNTAAKKQEKVVILDAGAQYGKVSVGMSKIVFYVAFWATEI